MQNNLIYGLHAVQALLEEAPESIDKIYVQRARQDKRMKTLLALANKAHIKVESREKRDLDELLGLTSHQGVAASCRETIVQITENDLLEQLDALEKPAFLLILDGVQDPHNLGACLRTAAAAGVDAVIAPKDRATGLTPVVKKIACGAAEKLPFLQVTNLARFMRKLQDAGVWFLGAAANESKTIYDTDLTGSIAWVLGAEGKGLRHNTQKQCDELLSIPMPGDMESLNVSVAAGVCLFETVRQREG